MTAVLIVVAIFLFLLVLFLISAIKVAREYERGIIFRLGRLLPDGPGTYYEVEKPSPPRIHLAEAAHRTLQALALESGVITIAET